MKKCSIILSICFLFLSSSYSKDKTIEEYIKEYPKFEQKKVEAEANKALKRKNLRLLKIKELVKITTKIGKTYKGNFYGRNPSGNLMIGSSTVPWIDVPDDQKYQFSERHFKEKKIAFIDKFISKKRNEYNNKKRRDITIYREKVLSSDKHIRTNNSGILYNFTIEEKDEWGAKISHNTGKQEIKYKDLPPSERKKIKSGFTIRTATGEKYENIQMISQNPAAITFYREDGSEASKRLRDLTESLKKHFNYSEQSEAAYLKRVKEQKARIALARARKSFWKKVDDMIMGGYIKNAQFQTFQAMEHGSLCNFGRWNSYYRDYMYDGNIFFLYGADNSFVANNEKYRNDLYYTGTYIYTTVKGMENTVQSYTFNKELARKLIVAKYDLQVPGTKPAPKSDPKPDNNNKPNVTYNKQNTPSIKGFGSGFLITKKGYIITNQHVVKGAEKVKVKISDKLYDAKIVEEDKQNDLAIIKIEGEFTPVAFSKDRRAQLGETAFVIGFPRPDLQGFSPKVTKGVISSLKGINDDARQYQIDAAIQPGNSGGPVADKSGNIIGVVVSKLNDAYVMKTHGDIAQNVNYAIKKSYIYALLDNYPKIADAISEEEDRNISFEKAVEKVNKATVLIITY